MPGEWLVLLVVLSALRHFVVVDDDLRRMKIRRRRSGNGFAFALQISLGGVKPDPLLLAVLIFVGVPLLSTFSLVFLSSIVPPWPSLTPSEEVMLVPDTDSDLPALLLASAVVVVGPQSRVSTSCSPSLMLTMGCSWSSSGI